MSWACYKIKISLFVIVNNNNWKFFLKKTMRSGQKLVIKLQKQEIQFKKVQDKIIEIFFLKLRTTIFFISVVSSLI